jgi:uncharacterized protein DUF4129
MGGPEMKKTTEVKGIFDLIEEATHLLRAAPSGFLAFYYLGAVPFILGLLYFWADMSRNPFADQHLAEAALGTAALFLWMKFWQAIFAQRLRAQMAALPPPRFDLLRAFRIATVQTALQPLGLLPIGICLAGLLSSSPFGFMAAAVLAFGVALLLPFFHNVTALSDGSDASVTAIFKKSLRFSLMWPRQNLTMLAVAYLFTLYVFINWSILCFSLPGLIKMLFSIESDFTRNPFAMLNTTFFAAMFGLTYLCVDPIFKTLYALRCFYGESIKSGEDLKAELKQFSLTSRAFTAAALVLILLAACNLRAAESTTDGSPLESPRAALANNSNSEKPASIAAPDLDHAIDQTIHERKFTWRMPREKTSDTNAKEGALTRFFQKISDFLRKCVKGVFDWLDKVLRKLLGNRSPSPSRPGSGEGWITASQLLIFVLLAAVVCTLVILIYRLLWQRRQPTLTASEPIQPVPDLADENVGADQLPEDGWTKLARELLERGEFRLAMRAFYLASLAHLAERNLISIARFKSNHDYERELRRRAHSFPDLLATFGDNLTLFERIWYGLHEVNGETVHYFAANVEKIKGAG